MKTGTQLRNFLRAQTWFVAKLLTIIVIGALVISSPSQAEIHDRELSEDNQWLAGSLDLALRPVDPDLTPTTIAAGESSSRTFYLQRLGSLPFQYSYQYQFASGNADVCNALDAELVLHYYDGGGVEQTVTKHSGPLASLNVNNDGSDPDLDSPNGYGYFANPDYAEHEHRYTLVVTLPNGASPALQNSGCVFELVATAWQQQFPNSSQGFSDTETLINTVNTGSWSLAAPENLGYNENNGDDYATPRPVTEIGCGGSTGVNGVSHHWTDVSAGLSNIKYQRQYDVPGTPGLVWSGNEIYTSPYSNYRTFGGGVGTPGTYNSRVRAFQDLDNDNTPDVGTELISDWSANSCEITYVLPAPGSSSSVSGSPFKDVENRIVNGDFEQGLTGWNYDGDVSVVSTGNQGITAHTGDKMALVGNITGTAALDQVSVLSQQIPNDGKGLRSIGFWYNFVTTETQSGFDDPGFLVLIGDQVVHQVWASEVVGQGSTGWKYLSLDVSQLSDPTLSLAFYAGNTVDTQSPSFVYLDGITTNETVVNSQAVITISADDLGTGAQAHYRYSQSGQVIEGQAETSISFSLTGQPDDSLIEYWAVDEIGQERPHQYLGVIYDNEAPTQITDLAVVDEGDGEYTLTFIAPADNLFDNVGEYQVRYSTTTPTDEIDWSSQPEPARMLAEQHAPMSTGQLDDIVLSGLEPSQQYYFVVRSRDRAHNHSAWSNVAIVNPALDQSSPQLTLSAVEDNQVSFSLDHGQAYDQANYSIFYQHLVSGQSEPILESVQGHVSIEGRDHVSLTGIYLGTCSEGGQVCVPHLNISDLAAEVQLIGSDQETLVISTTTGN